MQPTINLTGTAARIFEDAVTTLKKEQRNVCLADTHFLTAYALQMGLHLDLMEQITREGAVVPFEQGEQKILIVSPELKAADAALSSAKRAFSSLSGWVKNAFAIEF